MAYASSFDLEELEKLLMSPEWVFRENDTPLLKIKMKKWSEVKS